MGDVVDMGDWRRRRGTDRHVGAEPTVRPQSTGSATMVFGSGVAPGSQMACGGGSFTITHVSGTAVWTRQGGP